MESAVQHHCTGMPFLWLSAVSSQNDLGTQGSCGPLGSYSNGFGPTSKGLVPVQTWLHRILTCHLELSSESRYFRRGSCTVPRIQPYYAALMQWRWRMRTVFGPHNQHRRHGASKKPKKAAEWTKLCFTIACSCIYPVQYCCTIDKKKTQNYRGTSRTHACTRLFSENSRRMLGEGRWGSAIERCTKCIPLGDIVADFSNVSCESIDSFYIRSTPT